MKYDPNRKWLIEVTEQQLMDIINCVEDAHRFIAGQMELHNITSYIEDVDNILTLTDKLRELQPLVTPKLPYGSSYSWDGGECPDIPQHDFIARTYAIYRNLRHCIEKLRVSNEWNVYKSSTLTCGIPLAVCYPKLEDQ